MWGLTGMSYGLKTACLVSEGVEAASNPGGYSMRWSKRRTVQDGQMATGGGQE